jgi:hypothetical protein
LWTKCQEPHGRAVSSAVSSQLNVNLIGWILKHAVTDAENSGPGHADYSETVPRDSNKTHLGLAQGSMFSVCTVQDALGSSSINTRGYRERDRYEQSWLSASERDASVPRLVNVGVLRRNSILGIVQPTPNCCHNYRNLIIFRT